MTKAAEAGPGANADGAGKGRVLVLALSVILLAVGGILLFAGPPLYRMGVLDLTTARTGLHEVAMYVMASSVAVALLGLVWALIGRKQRAAIVAVLVMMAAGVGAGSLYSQQVMKSDLPPINDVQTDWSLPVAFTEKALREREHAGAIRVRDDAIVPEGQGEWSGMSFAEAQAKFYDGLKPLKVKQGVPETTLAASTAAKRLGWDVMLENPPDGLVEAVYHSPWYGLVYDIAVRVVPDGAGSRVDVRSTSRDAVNDLGENAAQVKQLIDEISLELR
jgi:fatty-acyl-CoA synthase